jgi:NAD(P)-dependent dehydrogenase (short-subunit alcohol dehydrogenase family)
MDLQGARVLVVGASSGIGREVAVQLGAGGARVVLAARRADRLADAVDAVERAGGGDAHLVACDVRDPAQCEGAVTAAV